MVEKKLNFNQPILSVRRYSQKGDQMNVENASLAAPRLRRYRQELNSVPVRNPGAVPFQWERAPGQPKDLIKPQTQYRNPGSSDNNIDTGDCDEVDVDELDLMSRTESFLSNSSICSLTDIDDLEVEPSRRFSIDPQAREVMMDRSKKQSAVEQTEEVKREATVNEDKPAFWYRPTFAKSCSHYEDSDHDRDQNNNLIGVCCLLPRSCVKSSVCILNPVPATNVRARLTIFQARGMQSGSSSADSLSETENEDMVKPVGKTDGLKDNKASLAKENNALTFPDVHLSEEKEVVCTQEDANHTCIEGFGSHNRSFKTLQELLADEDSRKELESRSRVERELHLGSTGTENMEDHENKAAKKFEKQILRATTIGNSDGNYAKFPVPPPLPRSPSDSWLFRTLPSLSTKKASAPAFVSRFSNKS